MKNLKLNLGSGSDIRDDYINIDFNNAYHPDMMWDLNNGIPFNDDSVSEIYASNVFEHLDPVAFENFIRELWRVCKKGSLIKVVVPIGRNWQKWPEHRIPFDQGSEEYFAIFNQDNKPIFQIQNKETELTPDGSGDVLKFELVVQ